MITETTYEDLQLPTDIGQVTFSCHANSGKLLVCNYNGTGYTHDGTGFTTVTYDLPLPTYGCFESWITYGTDNYYFVKERGIYKYDGGLTLTLVANLSDCSSIGRSPIVIGPLYEAFS